MTRKNSKNKVQTPDSLTEKEVFDVMDFARALSGTYQNIFTPDLLNARLKDVNMNPLAATEQEVADALLNPKENGEKLIAFSEFFEYTNMIYKRMLYYLGNMLSFDVNYVCTNAKFEDYTTSAYKEDEQEVIGFLDKFDIKNEFKKICRQLVRQDTYFGIFREGKNKCVFQELPLSSCKITGRSEWGYLFDFNMYWFMQPGVSLDMYPPYFKELYKRAFNGKSQQYNPANSITNRSGEWVYWVQTSQDNGCWCFKFNQEQAGQIPVLSPLFNEVVTTPLIRKLQNDKYMLQASKMLFGLVPLLKENKSGNIKDMLALDSTTIGKFLGLIRSALNSVIKIGAAPFDDVKAIDFTVSDQNILGDHNKNMSSSSGINSRLLYATDKMSAEETRNSISVDSYMMTYLYPQFVDFLNYQINKLTKKFKFKFTLLGTEFDMDKKNRLETATSLAAQGFVLPQLYSSALGMMPQDFIRQLEMAKAGKIEDKLIQLVSMYQTNTKNDKGGRPRSKNPTDSTIATQDSGANIERGGDI